MDPQHVYKAIVTSPPNFKGNRSTRKSIPFDLEMTLQPFKFDLNGLEKQEFVNNEILVNYKSYASKPLVKIYGEGNISIYFNKKEYKFTGVQGNIEIDSLEEEIYRIDNDLFINQSKNFLGSSFPTLLPGENEIYCTGNVTKVEIIPRWWTKI